MLFITNENSKLSSLTLSKKLARTLKAVRFTNDAVSIDTSLRLKDKLVVNHKSTILAQCNTVLIDCTLPLRFDRETIEVLKTNVKYATDVVLLFKHIDNPIDCLETFASKEEVNNAIIYSQLWLNLITLYKNVNVTVVRLGYIVTEQTLQDDLMPVFRFVRKRELLKPTTCLNVSYLPELIPYIKALLYPAKEPLDRYSIVEHQSMYFKLQDFKEIMQRRKYEIPMLPTTEVENNLLEVKPDVLLQNVLTSNKLGARDLMNKFLELIPKS